MQIFEPSTLPFELARECSVTGASDRALRRRATEGDLLRLQRGVYLDAAMFKALAPRERYLARIAAVVFSRKAVVTLGFESAAALWGCDRWGGWPAAVHLITSPNGSQSELETVQSHRSALAKDEVVEHPFGARVTSYARTLVDLARSGSYIQAVIALDQAMSLKRVGRERQTDRESLLAQLARATTSRGCRRAQKAIEFADALSDNGGESYSRVLIDQLGFPAPQLQRRHRNPRGGNYYTDFEWPDHGVVAEFDGHSKYVKPEYLGTMTPGEAVVEEKIREDHIRAEGFTFARWGKIELGQPHALAAILQRAGLPRRRR